jgi:hypothetical protein
LFLGRDNLFIPLPEPAITLWFVLSSLFVFLTQTDYMNKEILQNSFLKSTERLNIVMKFEELVQIVLKEESVSGGEGSVFGANVGATATPMSGDNYAPGDARNLFGNVFSGVLTRSGLKKSKKNKRKRKKSYKNN